ncbi:VirB4 family type IV secretion/conjugal transfer ATPase [Candidatus Neoehrlichia procyonis]|uniref:CagE, TrbE, VirB, component of type IV transporter system family protein n=1 Tax=Candidatus Neoehrlichia procyonis str. RAC413 TaxID=1359163 RepID=A0A0F3NN49_9RICK|nr:hypothetical protein [Candidatus Neoehrlichia lotoris]KJV69493.1 cagE, TrbE, VirB, component of type IV transporter system family protein [Candidatus Neoehrlichia lotoris str. RAC413]
MFFLEGLMNKLLFKGNDNVEAKSDSVHSENQKRVKDNRIDFISAACHYNENTILNRNGELIQIIKIEGYASNVKERRDVREVIRQSIIDSAKELEVSFWIYTVRKRHIFDLQWMKKNDFSDELHEMYKVHTDQKYNTYVTELYIAIVTSHLREDIKSLIGALSFRFLKKKHKDFLSKKCDLLDKITDCILKNLQDFNAKKLGLLLTDTGNYRSELLEFLNYLVTFRNDECFLEHKNNAYISSKYKIDMGFNVFRVTDNDSKKLGTILGIKEYLGVSSSAINVCLQQNCEFIIVEIIKFVNSKDVVKVFKSQADIVRISGDQKFAQVTCLDDFVNVSSNGEFDFCEHKINFIIISNTMQMLQKDIMSVVAALSVIGAIPVRFDLSMEDNFWSHVPGNFPFVLNMRYCVIKHACVFVMLDNFSIGALRYGRWGEAISIFFSYNKPYFFNFHVKNCGHCLFIGPHNSSMTLLINFILSESRNVNAKILLCDYSGKSIIFVKALCGKYYRIDSNINNNTFSFNPFNLEDNAVNRNVVVGVLRRMNYGTKLINDEEVALVNKVADDLFSIPIESRTHEKIYECLLVLGKGIKDWINDNKFAHFVKGGNSVNFMENLIGINIGMIISQPECISVIMYYFFNILETYLDGSPTILVIYEAWLMDIVFLLEKEFDDWMYRMGQLNVVVIFASESTHAMISSKTIGYLNKHIDTRVFMPNVVISSQLSMQTLGLSRKELNSMFQISEHKGQFFIKQGDASTVLTLDIKDKKEAKVLSATREGIHHMYDAIKEKGENAKDWLPVFYSKSI